MAEPFPHLDPNPEEHEKTLTKLRFAKQMEYFFYFQKLTSLFYNHEEASELTRSFINLLREFKKKPSLQNIKDMIQLYYEHPAIVFFLNALFKISDHYVILTDDNCFNELRYFVLPEFSMVSVPSLDKGICRHITKGEVPPIKLGPFPPRS